MRLERFSHCKVNLLLNVLQRRPDGFHELETLMLPVPICDRLLFETIDSPGIHLTCNIPGLPVDQNNLVVRAAELFFQSCPKTFGVRIHLDKQIPLAAGLGGGSGNAACTLCALNDLAGGPLAPEKLVEIAGALGSDIPFFLDRRPALACGRGEQVIPLPPFTAIESLLVFLVHPGFGIPTPWAYRQLARFPEALHGRPGRAAALEQRLQQDDLAALGTDLYNSLEAPALEKFPVLELYQRFLREAGALGTLMSGSGSTTFALFRPSADIEEIRSRFAANFGSRCWVAVTGLRMPPSLWESPLHAQHSQ